MILFDKNAFPEGEELQVLYLSRDAPIFRSPWSPLKRAIINLNFSAHLQDWF